MLSQCPNSHGSSVFFFGSLAFVLTLFFFSDIARRHTSEIKFNHTFDKAVTSIKRSKWWQTWMDLPTNVFVYFWPV